MPIYEYACTNGHRFEVRQSYSEDPLLDCTECGAPVRRVLHPSGVIFKGSGWYATDSRPASSEGASGSSEASGASSDAPKTDAKSASDKAPAPAKSDPAAAAADA